jgi:hypothetical protein
VKFELAGFKTVVNEGIHITEGFSAQVNWQLGVSTVQETITVSGQSPVVDTKATARSKPLRMTCCRTFRPRAIRG